MGIAEIIALIGGVFKFFDQVQWFVKLLQETPQEKHADLIKKIGEEARGFKETGRPKWD